MEFQMRSLLQDLKDPLRGIWKSAEAKGFPSHAMMMKANPLT